MSGASRPCCYVCGSTNLKTWRDQSEGIIYEAEDECPDCKLYEYNYAFGNSREFLAFVIFDRNWTDHVGIQIHQEKFRRSVLVEARKMWRNETCREFIKKIQEFPDDNALKLIFADWLKDHDLFPIQEQALRTWEENIQK